MMKKKNPGNRIIWLFLMVTMALTLSGCRTRLTNDAQATNTISDPDGMALENFEMRRDDLEMGDSKKSLFSGLFPDNGSDDEDYGFDEEDLESFDTEAEEDDYVYDDSEPTDPNTDPTNQRSGTTPSRTNPGTNPGGTTRTVTVSVSLNANGGSLTTNTVTRFSGRAYGTLPVPTKSGYTFDGWYTAKKGGSKILSTSIVASGKTKVTLYAHWKKKASETDNKEYTITFNPNGGTLKNSSQMIRELKVGDTFGTLPKVTRDGYTFDGWYTKKTGGDRVTKSTKLSKAGNIVLYAQWEKDEDPTEALYESYKEAFEEEKEYCDVKYFSIDDEVDEALDSIGAQSVSEDEVNEEVCVLVVAKNLSDESKSKAIEKVKNRESLKNKTFRIFVIPKALSNLPSEKKKALVYKMLLLDTLSDRATELDPAGANTALEVNANLDEITPAFEIHDAEPSDDPDNPDDPNPGDDPDNPTPDEQAIPVEPTESDETSEREEEE
ncbi:MAG: hypothetical protein E7220_01715 [Clostridiales bacterium]|nr:hypothetical protein [Clostridiales bacterium]